MTVDPLVWVTVWVIVGPWIGRHLMKMLAGNGPGGASEPTAPKVNESALKVAHPDVTFNTAVLLRLSDAM